MNPDHTSADHANSERDDLVDALEAFVLDQFDETTTEAYERSLRAHPDLVDAAADLREVLAGLAYDERADTPSAVRADMLAAAIRRRAPGIDDTLATGADAARCHRAGVELVSAAIDDLDEVDMQRPTIYGIPVLELIRHLNGVEHQLAQTLAAPDGPPRSGFTRDGHRDVRLGTDGDAAQTVIDAWHLHSEQLVATVAGTSRLDGTEVDVAGIKMSADRLLVVRSFELWSHAEDICRAVDRPPLVPPADVLHTMASHAFDLLLSVVGMITPHAGTVVRITLTGPGGGSWLRHIDATNRSEHLDPFAPAAATLVADVVDFCRLLADRADTGMAVQRYGDLEVCNDILELAPTLADYGAGPLT